MKTLLLTTAILLLAACAHSGGGQTEAYGEIKAGYETSRTR